MSGPVEWAVLIFVVVLAIGCLATAWKARGELASYQSKYDLALAALSRDIQDRNHLVKYDLANERLTADLTHLKNNFNTHKESAYELYRADHDNLIRAQAELDRLGKIVNGKH